MRQSFFGILMVGMVFLGGCGDTDSGNDTAGEENVSLEENMTSGAPEPTVLRVVSTPNPSLFPLLAGMYLNPDLSVEIVPVTGSKTIDSNLSVPTGDALVSMTYVAAKKSQEGSIVPMRLKSASYFHGFTMVTRQDDGITDIHQLKGKNLLVSGPIGSGENGGPDIFLQAYLAQNGLTAADFSVYYMPLGDGVQSFTAQAPLDNGDGNPDNDTPADAYLLVEPAATGMVLNMAMSGTAAQKGVDLQQGFPAYGSWTHGELPLGGLSVVRSVDDNASYAALISAALKGYNAGAYLLMNGTLEERRACAGYIAAQITELYGEYNISIPAEVIMASLINGALVYHDDMDIASIKSDLKVFLESVIGIPVDDAFFE